MKKPTLAQHILKHTSKTTISIQKTSAHHHTPAFTLLEMLLVIAIIAILAGIVIVAINPARQLAQARNAQRASDLRALNSAVQQYYIDNRIWPANLATVTTLTEICDTGSNEGPQTEITCDPLIDLSTLVPTYLSAIPKDPQGSIAFHNFINTVYANSLGTGYLIAVNPTTKTLELTAPKSLEYTLQPVQVGTTTALTAEGGVTPWDCGDLLVDDREETTRSYATVQIGDQCWMQQNLNVGEMVLGSTTQGTSAVNIEKYCYDDDESICTTDGGLYQWDQAMASSTTPGAQGICPSGWHIPTDTEWKTLVEGQATPGCESTITAGWYCDPAGSRLSSHTLNGNNESGFTALLAGRRFTNGLFYNRSSGPYFWSSVESSADAWRRHLHSSLSTVLRSTDSKVSGFSVRCLKN